MHAMLGTPLGPMTAYERFRAINNCPEPSVRRHGPPSDLFLIGPMPAYKRFMANCPKAFVRRHGSLLAQVTTFSLIRPVGWGLLTTFSLRLGPSLFFFTPKDEESENENTGLAVGKLEKARSGQQHKARVEENIAG